MPKPSTWTCNACEHEGTTSREHLIHIAIGRAILADRGMSPKEVRRHLQSGRFRDFRYFETIDDDWASLDVAWLNQEIRGLICETCNKTWARHLEEDAGNNLFDFTHLRGRADGPLLRRWACYFAIKLWFAGTRTEGIADGPLRPVLNSLAQPDVRVEVPLLVARVQARQKKLELRGVCQRVAGRGYSVLRLGHPGRGLDRGVVRRTDRHAPDSRDASRNRPAAPGRQDD